MAMLRGVFWVLLLAPALAAAQRAESLLRQDGRVVGHLLQERRVVDGEIHSRSVLTLTLRQRSAREHVVASTEFVETADGRPLRFAHETRAGTLQSRTDGEAVDGRWRLRSERGSHRSETWLEAPADLLFPAALQRRLAAGADFAYSALSAGDDGFVAWTMRADADGGWRRRRADGDRETTLRVDRGWLVEPLSALGLPLAREACAVPCADRVDDALSPLAGLLLPSPYRIPRAALQGTIRYLIAGPGDVPPTLPGLPGQQVRIGRRGAVVTVCATCVEPPSPPPSDLAAWRQPNRWIQSGHPRLRAMARAAAGSRQRPAARQMQALVDAVRAHMTGPIDYIGYASAVEALDARSGDCTESALLLAALARAQGIPARIVVGVAYASRFTGETDVFSPHMWVQAWTGERWENFDAGLGRFDAGHVALAIGDGEPAAWQGVPARLRGLRILDAAGIDAAAE